jgi:DNA-binding SARP family transcriptional activator
VLPAPASDLILVETDTLAWNPTATVRLDVDDFVAAARDRKRLDEAVDLYRGDFLPELYDEWLYAIRERYRNMYLTCLTDIVSEARRNGRFARAIEAAGKVLVVDPWREDIVRRLMALRYEMGDRAGALREFVAFAERLHAEMGIKPMAETAAIAEQIGQGRAVDDPDAAQTDAMPPSVRQGEQTPLVGRERELAQLVEAWTRAKQGRGSIVFLGGEPGIGKSRLAVELANRVEDDGGRVLTGATGVPESFPYQAIVEALRAGLPLVAGLALGSTWFAALATLLPELPERVGPLAALPALEAEQSRTRLFESLARAFAQLSKPRPLLLLLEDVHWASQATFDALAFIARRAAGIRLLIVVTFRDDEAHRRHPLRRLQREAEFEGGAATVSLPPLDPASVARIVQRTAGGEDVAALATTMYARSGGNPLFLWHLLAAPADLLTGAVPPTIGSLVSSRVAVLSEEARTVAEIAALAGERFALPVVREVAGWEETAMASAVDELLDRRIIRETSGRGIFRYAFSHQILQEAILDACDPDAVRERSRRIARVLGELYPERADEMASDIARHWERGDLPAAAAAHYLVAARRALELGALDNSLRDIGRALALATSGETMRELLLVRFTANSRIGDTAAQRADLDALAAIAESADDDDLRCTVLLRKGNLAVEQGQPEAHAIFANLRQLAEHTGNPRWEADADFGQAQLLELDLPVDEGLRLIRRAHDAYAQVGDDVGRVNALALLARQLSAIGESAEARRLVDEAIAAAEHSRDYGARVRALRCANGVAVDAGDRVRAAEVSRRWVDVAVAAGDRREEAVALVQSAWPLSDGPRFMHTMAILSRALGICEEWSSTTVFAKIRASVDVNTAEVWTRLGSFDKATPLLERAIAFHSVGSVVHTAGAESTLALALAHSGQAERAAAVAASALRAFDALGRTPRIAPTTEVLAEAEWRCGRHRSAIRHFETALALRRSANVPGSIAKDVASLAALHVEVGDLDGARSWIAQLARDETAFAADRPWPQRSAWTAAYAYRACGDDALATFWLGRALELFQAQLKHLDDEQSQTFSALPWHQAMLAANAGDWSSRFW